MTQSMGAVQGERGQRAPLRNQDTSRAVQSDLWPSAALGQRRLCRSEQNSLLILWKLISLKPISPGGHQGRISQSGTAVPGVRRTLCCGAAQGTGGVDAAAPASTQKTPEAPPHRLWKAGMSPDTPDVPQGRHCSGVQRWLKADLATPASLATHSP